MHFISCTYDEHAEAMLAIFNEIIATSTAIYEYAPRQQAFMMEWFEIKRARNFPVIGITDDDGALLGFATYGPFRDRPAYKYAIEHSVYVRKDQRGNGLGRLLMERLIALAREQQYHVIVAGVDLANSASIALHEALGFRHVATLPEVGFKFGGWLDLGFYQLILETPLQPVDG